MNKPAGGLRRFRWGKNTFMKTLGRGLPGSYPMSGRLFRKAPILGPALAWIASIAINDLRQPESRIKAFVRRILENGKDERVIKAVVVPPLAIERPDGERDRKIGVDPVKSIPKKDGTQ